MRALRRSPLNGREPSYLPVPHAKVGIINKTEDMTNICPYTLESRKDCQTIKKNSSKNVCFFTLEPCSH
jgi:hypothetical protein